MGEGKRGRRRVESFSSPSLIDDFNNRLLLLRRQRFRQFDVDSHNQIALADTPPILPDRPAFPTNPSLRPTLHDTPRTEPRDRYPLPIQPFHFLYRIIDKGL